MAHSTRSLALGAALLLVAAAGGCGEEAGDDEPGGTDVAQSVELEAYDYYFEPTALSVELGADVTIEFANNGGVTHSFTAPDLDVEVEAQNGSDATVEFTVPNQPGSFDFFCRFHPDSMNGTISIGGGDVPLEDQEDDDDEDADVEVDVDEEGDTEPGGDY
ncbi:MAG: cupredoxin domain-containing protein [Actinomycetota bacterium]|nr:cupredoxin domain-containing protein [Actinomycetota bacterium]